MKIKHFDVRILSNRSKRLPPFSIIGSDLTFVFFVLAASISVIIPDAPTKRSLRLFIPLPRADLFLLFITIAFLAGVSAKGDDLPSGDGDGARSSKRILVTSPSHPAAPNVGTTDKCSQVLEWSEVSGILTAKVMYSAVSRTGVVEEAQSDDRTCFLSFPIVELDAQNNLIIKKAFQRKLVLGYLKESTPGTLRVVLRSNIHLLTHLQNGTLSASLVSTSTTD